MSTIKRSFFVFLCVVIVGIFSVFPAFAETTVDYTLPINLGNPIDNGYDGYFSVPYRVGSEVYLQVVYWKFFRTSTPSDISNNDVLVTVKFTSNNTFDVTFDYLGDDVIGVYFGQMSSQYNKHGLGSWDVINFTDSFTTSVGAPSNSQFFYPQHYSPIYSITSISANNRPILSSFPYYSYSIVWNNNDTFNQLSAVLNHLELMLAEAELTNENFAELLVQFQSLLDTAYSLDYSLSEFVFYYWSQFQMHDFPTAMADIQDLLGKILLALKAEGDVEQTTVDNSKGDELLDIQESLLNNDEASSAIEDFDVVIDGQSYSFIWDLISRVFNSHPEVFGLVITILTLGFIALLLNR